MNIYIAGRFEDKDRLTAIRQQVMTLGHTVVSSWLDEESMHTEGQLASEVITPQQCIKYAARDSLEILQKADTLMLDTDGVNVRAGREVEFGIALFASKRVIIVGPRRNVFHHLADLQFDTWDEALTWLITN